MALNLWPRVARASDPPASLLGELTETVATSPLPVTMRTSCLSLSARFDHLRLSSPNWTKRRKWTLWSFLIWLGTTWTSEQPKERTKRNRRMNLFKRNGLSLRREAANQKRSPLNLSRNPQRRSLQRRSVAVRQRKLWQNNQSLPLSQQRDPRRRSWSLPQSR